MKSKKKLYLIQAGENGPIKIGVTYNVKKRLKQLQTGNHEKLNLILVLDDVGFLEERIIHSELKKFKIRGEWYRREVLILLDGVKKYLEKNRVIYL